ncbi:MAG: pitrilysin family protein [Patescibacteria group bacterium]
MYKKQTLKNGLTLITASLKETKIISVLLLVKVGSRYEAAKINGISHFIEHMMFKGTDSRPSTMIISQALDAVGADYNAFTAKDHTGYYIKINADKLTLALDWLADIIWHSQFKPVEIDKEKPVIIEEINMYEDNPLMYVEDLVEQLIFQNNKLGYLVIGNRQNIKAMSRQKLLAYRDRFYQPQNMVLGLVGNLPRGYLNQIKKYFLTPGVRTKKINYDQFESNQKIRRSKIIFKQTEQVQVALGWPAFSYEQPEVYAAYLLATILGGSMSSRLFIKIRGEQSLAYYVRAVNNVYQDTGCLLIQAGLDKQRSAEAINLILNEVEKIKKDGVTQEELKRAQEFFKGKVAIEMEDSINLAQWYVRQQLLTRKIVTPEEKIRKLFAVKSGDIQKVAQQICQNQRLSLAVVGPVKDLGSLKVVAK